jgi:hypothetical protein
MSSLRSKEGWLFVDDRLSGGLLTENPTYTCSHCNCVVVMNPLRNRERAFCRGCNSPICDACGVIKARTLQCVTFNQKADIALTAAEAGRDPSLILLP